MEHNVFADVETVLAELRGGKMIIVCDDEDRENEGDLVMAAEQVTPEAVNFMATKARGLICQAVTADRAAALDLPFMVAHNTSSHTTAFTVSVDVLAGATTGISAFDRAATIRAIIDPATRPEDLGRPGHIFPLIAREGGVLTRQGHTEATCDLMRLAGLYPSGILCEIIDDDGHMARLPRLQELAAAWNLKIITVARLAAWRREHDSPSPGAGDAAPGAHHGAETAGPGPKVLASAPLPTRFGDFSLILYDNPGKPDLPTIVLRSVKTFDLDNALVRVHSECLTGDVLGSRRCDCGDQLQEALRRIATEGGVLVYLRQEGRGIGLTEKIRAYALQDAGQDTVEANRSLGHEADERHYGLAARILRDLGITGGRLLTNNPAKVADLALGGFRVHERVPLEIPPEDTNRAYLAVKKQRLGHLLNLV